MSVRHRVSRTALVLASLGMLTAGPVFSPSADAAGVQVTHKEYKKVKVGMKPARVKRIVGAQGKVVDGSTDSSCYVRKYSGWSGKKVYFKFQDTDGSGIHLTEKGTTSQLPTLPPSCPSVS